MSPLPRREETLFYNHIISFICNVNSSEVAAPVATNSVAAPTDTTGNPGLTGGAGFAEININTIMQLGMIGVSGLFLMHLL